MKSYLPCPKCGGMGAERLSFTWWGGLIGPKVLNHVRCPHCSYNYNGKTGRDNTKGIIIYSIVVGIVVFGLVGAAVVAIALMAFMSR